MTAVAKLLPFEDTAPPDIAGAVSGALSVEVADAETLAGINADWRDLLARAADPNAFMDPALLRAAVAAYPDIPHPVLLAWTDTPSGRRLVGLWPFCAGRAQRSPLPNRVLRSPPFAHGFLGTPVIDRDCLEQVLRAMLDRIAATPDWPNDIAIDQIDMDGATMAALARVLRERGNAPVVLERRARPVLIAEGDPEAYLANAMSGSSRKKLRQLRNRLARQGNLTSDVVREPAAVARALEEFLALEASGWKKAQGTALLCDGADAKFFRKGFTALADRGSARIYTLRFDDRALAMQLVVVAGQAASTWKTAYDEAFAKFSPGSLLFTDYTAAFLEDAAVATVDSCAEDDSGYMAAWTGRKRVGDIRITARRGASAAFRIVAAFEAAYRAMRATAKKSYRTFKQGGGKRS
jgi:CelD/BcsL family acetyltransferase involved in cellulose biosynthesis